ncbi:hypothetical protein BABINDRAFT_159755 [Babjeviella inositovora NRRL Y-12698]|uniref:RRM domain-containing protein n=1 Tax=Babjeviella inositovora NRRL Y-12698 TaxID=984486 RepID=A0A1E3QUX0_9ASCO|nr:uncharacterized protein BABINDRAFT_159755 [Babjeviella inositovora NRRL Y-12698]ODQ81471.1 hypothetical protein BABINDRAFT_159755 [Babjeviella inositovora NRRL Y-12698]
MSQEPAPEAAPVAAPAVVAPASEEPATEQPEVSPANAIEGGREVSNKILYVGGLHKSVTEDMLRDLFSVAGAVQSIKILFDKNRPGFNYAFIEYDNTQAAEMAFQTLNGRVINNSEIKINWAFQSQQVKSSEAFNLFVGDLSPEVDDDLLNKTFSKFGNLIQAHVMWDMQTGRSRGYGFVSFSESGDAEAALQTMQGEWISGRAIRLNWASHKQNNRDFRAHHAHHAVPHGAAPAQGSPLQGGAPLTAPMGVPVMSPQSYDLVLRQTPSWQTTVYLGNLAHFTTQNELIPLLQNFGFIVDFKFHPERGCAFVKYDSHERAALAIVQLAGFNVNGRPLKCGWGKDRPPNMQYNNYRAPYAAQGRM